MCDIVTGLMIASTAIGTVGSIQQSNAAAADAAFQQQIANDNAKRTTEQMRDAAVRGADEEQQVMREGSRVVANTRGALASNYMDLTFGSPLDTIIETSVEVQKDAYRTRRNTQREIDDLEMQRTNQRNQASSYGAAEANAKTSGFVAGVGTALSGASKTATYRASIT